MLYGFPWGPHRREEQVCRNSAFRSPRGRFVSSLTYRLQRRIQVFSNAILKPIANSGNATRRPKIVRIIGRLVSGPARQACLLHEELTPQFETLLVAGTPCPGEHDMAYLLSSEDRVIRLSEMSREVSWWADLRALVRILRL